MARRARAKGRGERPAEIIEVSHRYCAARFPKPRRLPKGFAAGRARLIRETQFKWLNGSTLRYWFFGTPGKWAAAESQKNVVRRAFQMWKQLGIGLDFAEVEKRKDADVRIAFLQGDGAWSYIGTDVRTKRSDPRTMNFGWSLTEDPQDGLDTALHEIGHTIGFPHEHQNPFAGIVWNEEAVYAALAKPPNEWSHSETFHNIIEKIPPDTVQGSTWDRDSVMHYPFEPGLILKPPEYAKNGLTPAGGLSARDRQWALQFYPSLSAAQVPLLEPFQSVSLTLDPGQQADFRVAPPETRKYEFRTFGSADSFMALFEDPTAKDALAADDDSGAERNAYFEVKLHAGREYRLRVRLAYAEAGGQTAVMVW